MIYFIFNHKCFFLFKNIYSYGAESTIRRPVHGFDVPNNPSIESIKTTQFLHDYNNNDVETPQQKRENYTKIPTNIKKKQKKILLSGKKNKKDKEKKSKRAKNKKNKDKKTKRKTTTRTKSKRKKKKENDDSGYETTPTKKKKGTRGKKKKVDYTKEGNYNVMDESEYDDMTPKKRKCVMISSLDMDKEKKDDIMSISDEGTILL